MNDWRLVGKCVGLFSRIEFVIVPPPLPTMPYETIVASSPSREEVFAKAAEAYADCKQRGVDAGISWLVESDGIDAYSYFEEESSGSNI